MPHQHSDKKWVVYEWELVPRFYNSSNALRLEISRYAGKLYGIKQVQRGGNGRCMLVDYDSLKSEIKTAIGDPRQEGNAIMQFYKVCSEAAIFFAAYKLDDDSLLPTGHQEECIINASVLKACLALRTARQEMRKTSRNLLPSIISDLQALNGPLYAKHGVKHSLPLSVRRWRDLADSFVTPMEYKGKQYQYNYMALISGKLRNQNSAKVKQGDVSEDMLLALLEHPNQYDDKYIEVAYNKQAKEAGLKPITMATVGIWRRKYDHLIKASREGWNVFKDSHSRSVKRNRPSQPTYLWESDDNHLDILFNGDDGSPYHRYKGIFVTDSHSDLVLGYACMQGEMNPQLVKLAYINAMYYVRSLTGGWYLPHELKTDRWRLATLRPFYEKIGHYYDTPVNSKNRGWLENFFGCDDWKRCLKADAEGLPAVNYTGNNITAKNPGFNREMSRVNTKLYPHTSEAPEQIQAFVHRLRNIDLDGTGSREMKWLQAWANLPETEKRQITDEQFLLLFGLYHDPQNGQRNSIEKTGISATIMGKKMSYAVPPALYLQNVGKKVDVFFDPMDTSRVLVTDGDRIQFVAYQMHGVPGSMRDMQLAGEGARAFLNEILEQKYKDVEYVVNSKAQRQARLRAANIDIESVLQLGGMMSKEIMQAAETKYIGGGDDNIDFDPAEQM